MNKIIILLFTFLLIGCRSKVDLVSEKPLYELLTYQKDGGARIRFFEILTEEREIKMLLNDSKLKKKVKASDTETSNFVIFNMGEQSAAYAKIFIESVVETDDKIIIFIREEIETNPNPIIAFTYPFMVVKINSKKEIVIK